jgi:hypothetical protein
MTVNPQQKAMTDIKIHPRRYLYNEVSTKHCQLTSSSLVNNERLVFVEKVSRRYIVRSKVRHAIHLQFNISANALEMRAVQNPNCIV